MKRLRLLPLLLLLVAFGEPPVLPDASLDDPWFKLSLKAKGRAVEADGSVAKASVSLPAFLHLVLDESGGTEGVPPLTAYSYELLTEIEPGTWAVTGFGNLEVVVTSEQEYILPDVVVQPQTPEVLLDIRATLKVSVKLDAQEQVKSAKLTTLGGEVFFGGTSAGFFYGSAKLTGHTVDVADLPFTPF